jgi:hypothetical protein
VEASIGASYEVCVVGAEDELCTPLEPDEDEAEDEVDEDALCGEVPLLVALVSSAVVVVESSLALVVVVAAVVVLAAATAFVDELDVRVACAAMPAKASVAAAATTAMPRVKRLAARRWPARGSVGRCRRRSSSLCGVVVIGCSWLSGHLDSSARAYDQRRSQRRAS